MRIFSSVLLCTAFALASATRWYSNPYKARVQKAGYFDSRGYFHPGAETAMTHETFSAARTQQQVTPVPGLDICKSARDNSGRVSSYLHVCENGESTSVPAKKEYCYITDGACCKEPVTASPVLHYELELDQLTVNVKYYSAFGARGTCFLLDQEDLEVCDRCPVPECTAETRCIQNTRTGDASSCTDDTCVCKEGFAPPDCCECDLSGLSGRPHYKDPVTGECKPVCENCVRPVTADGCSSCNAGFTGRDCCDCDGIVVDGVCKKVCTENTLFEDAQRSCDGETCRCKVGYAPPDCCECDVEGRHGPPHYKDPVTKECKPVCKDCAELTKQGCTRCTNGFTGRDCCDCDGIVVDGVCKKVCTENTLFEDVQRSCDGKTCRCKVGYAPPDCCECDVEGRHGPPHYKDPVTKECKPVCKDCAELTEQGCTRCTNGFTGHDCCDCDGIVVDGVCKKVCTDNTLFENVQRSCDGKTCRCKVGYAPPDCCECDVEGRHGPPHYKDPVTKECKPVCKDCAELTEQGCTRCINGFTGRDCCDCDGIVVDGVCKKVCTENTLFEDIQRSCDGKTCRCKVGYAPPDCCECDVEGRHGPPHYKDPVTKECKPVCKNCAELTEQGCTRCTNGFTGRDCCDCVGIVVDGVCEKPCFENTVTGDARSCTREKCTCKSPFTGDDCCSGCVSEQDIYFIFDNTNNNNKQTFCETHYGTELLLKALNPGASTSGTRVEALLYPTVGDDRNKARNAYTLFGMGAGCREAVGETLNLVDGFIAKYYPKPESPLLKENQLRGNLAYPATPLESVRKTIEAEVSANPELTDRRRVVIMIANKETDEYIDEGSQITNNPNTFEEAEALRRKSQLTLIVAGNNADFKNRRTDLDDLHKFLNKVASGSESNTGSAVIEDNPFDMIIGIANRMAAVGAICETQRKQVVDQLEEVRKNTAQNKYTKQCNCIQYRRTNDNQNSCRVPEEIRCPGDTSGNNPYYVGSPNYPPSSMATLQGKSKDSKNSQLEQEILQAVEEVLRERMSNE